MKICQMDFKAEREVQTGTYVDCTMILCKSNLCLVVVVAAAAAAAVVVVVVYVARGFITDTNDT
jgi:hypothetical protein